MPVAGNGHPGRRVQYAALPYRVRRDGEVQLRLVTSRETRRWVIPKGWPIKGLSPAKTAAREAYEEAGLMGAVAREAIGIYTYEKNLGIRSVLCDVMVFPLKVKRHLQKWPERSQRYGFWFSIDSAAAAVQEEELKVLILSFGELMAARLAAKQKAEKPQVGTPACADAVAAAQAAPVGAAGKKRGAAKALPVALPVATAEAPAVAMLAADDAPLSPKGVAGAAAKDAAKSALKADTKAGKKKASRRFSLAVADDAAPSADSEDAAGDGGETSPKLRTKALPGALAKGSARPPGLGGAVAAREAVPDTVKPVGKGLGKGSAKGSAKSVVETGGKSAGKASLTSVAMVETVAAPPMGETPAGIASAVAAARAKKPTGKKSEKKPTKAANKAGPTTGGKTAADAEASPAAAPGRKRPDKR